MEGAINGSGLSLLFVLLVLLAYALAQAALERGGAVYAPGGGGNGGPGNDSGAGGAGGSGGNGSVAAAAAPPSLCSLSPLLLHCANMCSQACGEAAAMTGIAGTTVVVLAFFRIMGWGLGLVEGLCVVVTVGLSVDYCCHMLHALGQARCECKREYGRTCFDNGNSELKSKSCTSSLSPSPSPTARPIAPLAAAAPPSSSFVSLALHRIGPTILASAGTTMAATLLLLLCQVARVLGVRKWKYKLVV